MTTIPIRDANGDHVEIELPLPTGRTDSANSRPVTLAVEDAAVLDALVQVLRNTGAVTDRSGVVATGGTSQTLAPANANRKYIFVQNPHDATESLYINFGAVANATHGVELIPGCHFVMPNGGFVGGFVTNTSVTVTANTTSHRFIAKEA